jgi:hypothetical protein
MNKIFIIPILLLLCSSCASAETQPPPAQVINVYATLGTLPWLSGVYACANQSAAIVNLTDPQTAEIVIQMGEPEELVTPAYQIDTEEILIVTHRESPVHNLTLAEARSLFMGQGDPSIQVWVYDAGQDVQKVFEQAVMAGGNVTSQAKVAASPQQMSDVMTAEQNAIGILPRHWRLGTVREVYSVATVPVLVIVKDDPVGVLMDLVLCLQK